MLVYAVVAVCGEICAYPCSCVITVTNFYAACMPVIGRDFVCARAYFRYSVCLHAIVHAPQNFPLNRRSTQPTVAQTAAPHCRCVHADPDRHVLHCAPHAPTHRHMHARGSLQHQLTCVLLTHPVGVRVYPTRHHPPAHFGRSRWRKVWTSWCRRWCREAGAAWCCATPWATRKTTRHCCTCVYEQIISTTAGCW